MTRKRFVMVQDTKTTLQVRSWYLTVLDQVCFPTLYLSGSNKPNHTDQCNRRHSDGWRNSVHSFPRNGLLCFWSRNVCIERQTAEKCHSATTPSPCFTAKGYVRVCGRSSKAQAVFSYVNVLIRMPSTHSAVTGYYTCYIFLSCFYLQLHRFIFLDASQWGMVFLMVVLPCTASIALSRVVLGHHTWPQVVAGIMYGIAFAIGWFTMWLKGAK